MFKNKYISVLKIYGLVVSTFFEVLFAIALLCALLLNGDNELKISFLIVIGSLFVIQHLGIFLLDIIFSRYGKNKIEISDYKIKLRDVVINSLNDRLIYSKVSIQNFFLSCPGELIGIVEGKRILIGYFTNREISKMNVFLKTIKFEPKR